MKNFVLDKIANCRVLVVENLACMKKIPVSVVMKYVDELLENYGEPAEEIPREYGKYQCRVVEL